MTSKSDIAATLLGAAEGIESVSELLHALGTANRDGGFVIEGETVKWLADQLAPIYRTLLDMGPGMRSAWGDPVPGGARRTGAAGGIV